MWAYSRDTRNTREQGKLENDRRWSTGVAVDLGVNGSLGSTAESRHYHVVGKAVKGKVRSCFSLQPLELPTFFECIWNIIFYVPVFTKILGYGYAVSFGIEI